MVFLNQSTCILYELVIDQLSSIIPHSDTPMIGIFWNFHLSGVGQKEKPLDKKYIIFDI